MPDEGLFPWVLAAVCLSTAVISVITAIMVRGITFFGTGTDNEQQARAAASAGKWRWPSDMHQYGGGKTRMKDGVVLGLAVTQRLLRDRTSEYPIIILCVAANAVSAVLVFLVASSFWNVGIGLLLWALLLSCFWPYQLALFGAHICIGQAAFLASVYLMQLAPAPVLPYSLALYLAAGLAAGFMMFSSASSRKYLPLLIVAFIFSQRQYFSAPELPLQPNALLSPGVSLIVIGIGATLLLGALALRLSYKPLVTAIFHQRAPRILSKLISLQTENSLQHYLVRGDRVASLVIRLLVIASLYLLISLPGINSVDFYWSHAALFLGLFAVVALFTLPDVARNLLMYFSYWNAGNMWGHFALYKNYFDGIGHPIKDDMRGAGLLWIFRFFRRVAPFHSGLYVGSLVFIGAMLVFDPQLRREAYLVAFIVLFSLSPILLGELTRSPQLGRTYFPALVGILLLVGYVANLAVAGFPPPGPLIFWIFALGFLTISAAWNIRMFVTDVWPSRMAPAWLGKTLRNLGSEEFYTYDTPYNAAFVDVLSPQYLSRYRVNFIESLQELDQGYVLVPGTSAKALNMESQQWAIKHGDFNLDPELNRLIDSKEIAQYAVASFKTFGTSRIWGHESEVASYRDLFLKEIDDTDRWRGRAWIVDVGKLRQAGQQ
ncbi:MAG: hypothetical protein ACE5Q6_05075 [Dehalococcoidia bacterium]